MPKKDDFDNNKKGKIPPPNPNRGRLVARSLKKLLFFSPLRLLVGDDDGGGDGDEVEAEACNLTGMVVS